MSILAVSACSGGTSRPSEDVQPAPPQSEASTYRSVAHRYEVAYPTGWRVVGERLTPNLDDPREILAIATYEAPVGGKRCAHQPVAAVEKLGRADALIVIFERQPPWPEASYPPRQTIDLTLDRGTGRFCVPDPERLDAWLSFQDAGRAFYLLVAVGPDAPARTRREVREILDGLTFQAA